MNKAKARQILEASFAHCNDDERARLLYHAKRGTPILCGEASARYVNGKGAG